MADLSKSTEQYQHLFATTIGITQYLEEVDIDEADKKNILNNLTDALGCIAEAYTATASKAKRYMHFKARDLIDTICTDMYHSRTRCTTKQSDPVR